MANASHNHKKPNKQHDLRGSVLVRLASRLRARSKEYPEGSDLRVMLEIVGHEVEQEGIATRKMR